MEAVLRLFTVKQLQSILKKQGLKTSGNKDVLVHCLLDSLEDAGQPQEMIDNRHYTAENSVDVNKLINTMIISNLPHPDSPIFNGEAMKYQEWESAFNTLIHERPIPQAEKIFYLGKYVTRKAKEAIES